MVSRVNVTLVGIVEFPKHATVIADSASRQGRAPQPGMSVGSRLTPASVARVASVPGVTLGRDTLVLGVDQPGPTNTGVLPGIPRTTVNGSVTLSTPGQVYQNMTVTGRLSITAANVTVRNCEIQGNTAPASGVINCTNAAVSNALIEDCTIKALKPHYTWNGVYGHDFTLRRCDVSGTTDIVDIVNSSATQPYATGVVLEQNWLHGYVWWTAATGNVVHPTDTETHNDVIQQSGGTGTIIRGNTLDAAFSKQAGHWFVTDPTTEPYTTVALHSLSDGGPYQNIPDRGSGTESNGRYNWDDNCCLMINATSGYSSAFTFDDNWCYGGNFAINGGGNNYPGSGVSLGNFRRNKFDRTQGNQGSGGDNTHTIDFGGSNTWVGHVNVPTTGADKNYYLDNGNAITVRY